MLDLHDIGTPLAEDGARHWHEDVRRDLDDANPLERCGHAPNNTVTANSVSTACNRVQTGVISDDVGAPTTPRARRVPYARRARPSPGSRRGTGAGTRRIAHVAGRRTARAACP